MELYLVLGISLLGLVFAVDLARDVLRRDAGTPAMREIDGDFLTLAEVAAALRGHERRV